MAQSRSFKEYVKNNLDNQMWKAIEDFLPSLDPYTLDLRLNRVRNVGEVELYDTELQFVDVSDLPGSTIEFDVVMDATLIVYDEDHYHNDESEATHQWFMLRCRGSLDCKLNDLEIYDINVYNSRNRRNRPMSNALVPIIYKDDLEKEAEAFLRKYYKEALLQPMWVDPIELARRMNLTVLQHRISEDMTVFGQIYFRETEATLYDSDKKCEVEEHILPGTVVVDPSVVFQRNLGAFNTTIVHECVHWALHKKAFALEQLFNAEASQIKCQVVGGVEGQEKDDTTWMEWQANALAPRIQMPLAMFKRQASATLRRYRDQLDTFELCELMPFVIEDLSTFFMVSRLEGKLRMVDAGYDEAIGSFVYIDGHYVKPHTFKKGSIKHNQTYSIPATDAAIQSIINPRLQEASNYIYIDSHFVLNHPKYVYQNDDGETLMTDYARYHMDECCLSFDLSIRGRIEERYHWECFLNRDQGSPIEFDIVYTGENGELDNERRKKLLHDTVMEEAKVLDGLSNHYTKAWKELLKGRGISQAELSRRTKITEKTIGNIINGDTVGTINNVVLMCLAANLPWDMSDYIIKRSGHQLMLNNDDHNWYRFVLKHMYPKSIPEIRAFLRDQGASPL